MVKYTFLILLALIAFSYQSNEFNNNNFSIIYGRVTGGSEIKSNSAPFMISIQQKSDSTSKVGSHYCGGVILNEHWILTAAHCLPSPDNVKKSIVVAGAHNILTIEKTTQIRQIDYYKNHELYNGGTSPYDLALIYTKTKFEFNKFVEKIGLPKKDSTPVGQSTLYGWGSISITEKPKFPNILHSVEIPIIQNDECKRALGSQGINLHNTNLCTGPLTGGKGICQADSGGPLVQKNILIGIVSWGKKLCGQPNSPSVFVRVSALIDWIEKQQKDHPK